MKHSKAIRLLYKYLYGKPSLAEKARVDKWYQEADETKVDLNEQELAAIKEQIYQRTWNQINVPAKVLPFYRKTFFQTVAAAVVVLLITGSYFLFFNEHKQQSILVAQIEPSLNHDVAAPVTNKAVLTLADGSIIILDSAKNGSLVQQGSAVIARLNDGKITYSGSPGTAATQYNTLTVPKGSKPVQLILSDGTGVWLNVASSITYPTAFSGKERKVEMKGEAYFEVTHNAAMPFKVKKDGVEVQVLGTHFNVNGYDDESSLKVTLLEGSIKVNGSAGRTMFIKPGQQAEVSSAAMQLNTNIDTDEVMAWKNGWFNFNSLKVTDIMRQIDKWYDVEVVYEGKTSQKHFSGIVSRDNNVSEVLKIMQQAGIKFLIEGRRIIVQQ